MVTFNQPQSNHKNHQPTENMSRLWYAQETFNTMGACFAVQNFLGTGFVESVYKDALTEEFKFQSIPFRKEVNFQINYKGQMLPHTFKADFVVFDSIILEIKAVKHLKEEHMAQTINYCKVSQLKLALLINFGEKPLVYQRFVV